MIRPARACGVSKVTRFGLAASLLALSALGGAAAQQGPARQACGADLNQVCAGIQPGDGRISACVREHFSHCRDALRGRGPAGRYRAEHSGLGQTPCRVPVGIHQGDNIVDDNDIFGDGVNIAARLEGLAEPGTAIVAADL